MSKVRTGPLADERLAAASATAEFQYARRMRNDLKWLVEQPQGRRVLARLIFDTCGVMYGPPWNPSADIHRVAGRREVGEDLLRNLEEMTPHEARQMVNEWFADRHDRKLGVQQTATETTDGERDQG